MMLAIIVKSMYFSSYCYQQRKYMIYLLWKIMIGHFIVYVGFKNTFYVFLKKCMTGEKPQRVKVRNMTNF